MFQPGDLVYYEHDFWIVTSVDEIFCGEFLGLRHATDPLRKIDGAVPHRDARPASLLERLAVEAARKWSVVEPS